MTDAPGDIDPAPIDEELRKALERATAEARRRSDSLVTPEHLILGILRRDSIGSATLAMSLGTDRESLADLLAQRLPERQADARPVKPATASALQSLLKKAHAEAERLGSGYMGTEHIILMGLQDQESALAQQLRDHPNWDRRRILADFEELLFPDRQRSGHIHPRARRLCIDDFPAELHANAFLQRLLGHLESLPEEEYQRSEFLELGRQRNPSNGNELTRITAEIITRLFYERGWTDAPQGE